MGAFKKQRELPFCTPSIDSFDTFIGNPTEIHGRIVSKGSVRIDGKIIGNIESPANSNSSIAIGRTGIIHGDIFAQSVLVAGQVEGNIYAKDKVTLHQGSEVRGDVTYSQIHIEHGAKINGLLIARIDDQPTEPNTQVFSESWEKIKNG
jgi:cytoskeletal protein CcmA (bactofilin family)